MAFLLLESGWRLKTEAGGRLLLEPALTDADLPPGPYLWAREPGRGLEYAEPGLFLWAREPGRGLGESPVDTRPTSAVTDEFSASGTWTAPAALAGPVTCQGTGGGSNGLIGAGGGGGAYATAIIYPTPGTVLTVVVGLGEVVGTDSTVTGPSGTIIKAAGAPRPPDTGTPSPGGQASNCIGDAVQSGSPGTLGDGVTPGNGGAGAGPFGGAGGAGEGGNGSIAGGGGAGAYVAEEGVGANGLVRLSYRVYV